LIGRSWRIVFFGTPPFAIPTMKSLLSGPDEVIAVVTQPDREKGRGRKVVTSPVKDLALQEGLSVFQPEKAKEEAFQKELGGLQPDLFVVIAYGQILPLPVLKIPKHGAINVHASLLPKYRGAAPIAWAILRGEGITGVTTMMMDKGMDTGDILLQKSVPIEKDETGETLHDRLAAVGAQLLQESLEGMKAGTLRPIPQDHSKATYAPPLKKTDGLIDWRKEAIEIDRLVRGLNPWPGAFAEWEGKSLKIYKGEVRKGGASAKPGVVVWVGSNFIEVATGRDSFLIKEVQMEGKKRMSIRDFLPGHPITSGVVLGETK